MATDDGEEGYLAELAIYHGVYKEWSQMIANMTTPKQYKKIAENTSIEELIDATDKWVESNVKWFNKFGPCSICGENPYVVKRLVDELKRLRHGKDTV